MVNVAMDEEPTLLHLQAFAGGFSRNSRGKAREVVDFVETHGNVKLALIAGQHTVVSGFEAEPDCTFLDTHAKCAEVLAVCSDPSKQLIAVCERVRADGTSDGAGGEGRAHAVAQVSIYHTGTRECLRTLTYKHTVPRDASKSLVDAVASSPVHLSSGFDFVLAAWSGDASYLAAYACKRDGSEGVLVLYKWKSKKVIGVGRLPAGVILRRICINPHCHVRPDGTAAPVTALHISASGNNYLRSWRPVGDGTLREVPLVHPKRENEDFVDHAWLRSSGTISVGVSKRAKERRLAALTAAGHIYIIARHDTENGFSNQDSARMTTPSGGSGAPFAASAESLVVTGSVASGPATTTTEIWELKAVIKASFPDLVANQVAEGLIWEDPEDADEKAHKRRRSIVARSDVASVANRLSLTEAHASLRLYSISATAKGFVVCGNFGFVAVYERADTQSGARVRAKAAAAAAALTGAGMSSTDLMPSGSSATDAFVQVKSFAAARWPTFRKIIMHNDEVMALVSAKMGVTTFSIAGIDAVEDVECQIGVTMKPLYLNGPHVHRVLAVSGSVAQNRVATCGDDHTVRVWNYMTNTSELAHVFTNVPPQNVTLSDSSMSATVDALRAGLGDGDTNPSCISMHCSGHLLAVGFKDKLCIFNVCASSLHLWRQLPVKNVNAMCFSKAGAYLAVASSSTVYVYSAYSMEPIHTLSAHVGVVRDIAWSVDDNYVSTVGEDGAVFFWSLFTGKREERYCNVIKGVKFSSVQTVCVSLAAAAAAANNADAAPATRAGSEAPKRRSSVLGPSSTAPPNTAITTVKAIVACGSGSDDAHIIYCCTVPDGQITKIKTEGAKINKLVVDVAQKKVYCGTSIGSVRVFEWPFAVDPSTLPKKAVVPTSEADTSSPAAALETNIGALKRASSISIKPGKSLSNAHTSAHEEKQVNSDAPVTDAYDELVTSSAGASCHSQPTFTEYHLHVGQVSGLHVSADSRYLLSVGEDGVMFVLGVPYRDAGKYPKLPSAALRLARKPHKRISDDDSADNEDIVGSHHDKAETPSQLSGWLWEPTPLKQLNVGVTLLPRVVYDEAMAKLAASEAALKEAKDDSLRSLARANSEFAAKLSNLNEQAELAVGAERTKYDALAARHEAYVRESVAAREKAESDAAKRLAETANRYERRLAAEMQRYDELQEDVIAVKQAAEEALSKAEIERKTQVTAILTSATKRQTELESIILRLKAGLSEAADRHNAILEDAEQENEDFINKLKLNMESSLLEESKRTAEKQGIIAKVSKQLSMLSKQIKALEKDLEQARADNFAKDTKISQLQEQGRSLNRFIEEQNAAISDKERDVASLRSEKRTLEAFRFVLDHRLAEMDADRAPVAEHIAEIESHVKAVYEELVSKFRESKEMDRVAGGLQEKLHTVTTELRRSRHIITEKERVLDNLLREIEHVAHGPDGELREGVTYLMAKYIKGAKVSAPHLGGATSLAESAGAVSLQEHREAVEEVVRQREFMRRGASALARQASSVAKVAGHKTAVAVSENLGLMDEANTLRQEVVYQRRRIHNLEADIHLRSSTTLHSATPTRLRDTPKRHAISTSTLPSLTPMKKAL